MSFSTFGHDYTMLTVGMWINQDTSFFFCGLYVQLSSGACGFLAFSQVAALMHRVQESESLLKTLQEAFSQAKRNTQEQMVSSTFLLQPLNTASVWATGVSIVSVCARRPV